MANRTVKDAKSIKGTNPQYLVEKIIRSRIYDCKYWKEECFALTAELLVDKAMELRYLGGVHGGNVKPSPFLCLILKMLQIQPEKDIIVEFIKNDDYKYVRALGAYYMRLTGTSLDCFNYLEPLYNDYRKLRRQNREGSYELVFMDEFIDELLREERVCDVILPRLQKRQVMEENNEIQPRLSVLEDSENEDLDEDLKDEEPARESSKTGKSDHKKRKTEDIERKSSRRTEREREGRRHRKSSTSSHSSSDSSPDRDRNRRRERERRSSRERNRDNVSSRRHDRGRDSSKDRDRDRRRERGDRDNRDRADRSHRGDRDEQRSRNDRDRHRRR